MENTNYVTILNEEFEIRRSINPQYSLRAYARDLTLSPSTLSEVLRGKHHLSTRSAEKVVEKLRLSDSRKLHFLETVALNEAKDPELKKELAHRIKNRIKKETQKLPLDIFKVVSDWQHFAIIELMGHKDFKSDYEWVAELLNLDVQEVEASVQRLVKIGALNIINAQWQRSDEFDSIFVGNDIPSQAIRKFHKQVLMQIAQQFELPLETREYSTTLFSLTQDEFKKVKKLIKNFEKQVIDLVGEGPKDDLYAMGIQLVPLTQDIGRGDQ